MAVSPLPLPKKFLQARSQNVSRSKHSRLPPATLLETYAFRYSSPLRITRKMRFVPTSGVRPRSLLSVQIALVRVSKISQITDVFRILHIIFDAPLSISPPSRVVLMPDQPAPATSLSMETSMNSTRRFVLALAAAAALTCIPARTTHAQSQPAAPSANPNASATFDKLKALVGTWESDTPKGKITAKFELTSGGTALLEHLSSPFDGEMVTIYTLDRDRVLLTHYCHGGNQPRMQASAIDPKTNQIDFTFVDATGLASPNDPHMHQAVFTLTSASEITENWSFYKDGKAAMILPLTFHRVS
jgi:hypothetical protein